MLQQISAKFEETGFFCEKRILRRSSACETENIVGVRVNMALNPRQLKELKFSPFSITQIKSKGLGLQELKPTNQLT